MDIRSLRPIESEPFGRMVIADLDSCVSIDLHQTAQVFTSLPASGDGVLAVQAESAMDSPELFANEVAQSGYAYVFVQGAPELVAEVLELLPSRLQVDGVVRRDHTFFFRVFNSVVPKRNSGLLVEFASLFPETADGSPKVIEAEAPRMNTLRLRAFDAGVRFVKPYKDYLPTWLTITLYRIAHVLRGK